MSRGNDQSSQGPGQEHPDRSAGGGDRGQVAIIAIVLLIGIVAIGSVGILLIGANTQGQSQKQVQDERVRQSFVELDSDLDSVAASEGGSRTVQLDLPDEADFAIRREDAGQIVVNRTNLTDTSTVVVKRLGAIVYENEDTGTQYAYQAGAVWRGNGNDTQMVSAPGIEYDTTINGGDPTLTLPIPDIEGPSTLNAGELQARSLGTEAPLNDVARIDNQLVSLEITSDYYVGWANYFRDRYQNSVVNVDHPNNTATIYLGRRSIAGQFDGAVVAGGGLYIGNGNPSTSGPLQAGGTPGGPGPPNQASCQSSGGDVECTSSSYQVLDSVINSRVSAAENRYPNETSTIESGVTLTAGAYYTEGFLLDGETLTFDLADGNVSLFVDGPIGLTGGGVIEVINSNNASPNCCYARVYVGDTSGNGHGDFALQNGGSKVTVDGNDAARFQMYGTSEMHFAIGQGDFEGGVYAPHGGDKATGSNEAIDRWGLNSAQSSAGCTGGDVCVGQGSPNFDGALVGFHDVNVAQASSVSYDPSLAGVDPTLGFAGVVPPPITFLHVAVNRVCVTDDSQTTEEACPTDGNTPPTVSVSGAPASMNDESSTGLSVTADDPDGTISSASYTVVSGPGSFSGGVPPASGGTASASYSVGDIPADRTVTLRVTVTDNGSATASDEVSFTVNDDDGNDPPQITGTSIPSTIEEGTSTTFSVTANDPEGDSLTYSWNPSDGDSPDGTVSGSGSTVTYTAPSVSSNEPEEVTVTVDDGNGGTVSRTVSFTVTDTGGGNAAPVADFDYSPSNPGVGVTVNFDGSPSSDSDGTVDEYRWDFDGDGTYETDWSTSATASYAYGTAGDYDVTLQVRDDDGATGTATRTVSVVARPVVTIDSATKFNVGSTWTANVEFTPDDPDGNLDTGTVEVLDAAGNVIDSTTVNLNGDEGIQQTETFTGLSTEPEAVRVTAEDADGNTGSATSSLGGIVGPSPPSVNVQSVSKSFSGGPGGGTTTVSVTFGVDDPNGNLDAADIEFTVSQGASSTSKNVTENLAGDEGSTVTVTTSFSGNWNSADIIVTASDTTGLKESDSGSS